MLVNLTGTNFAIFNIVFMDIDRIISDSRSSQANLGLLPEDYKTGKAQYGPGNFVKIRYQNGTEVTDMHLSSVKVKIGDQVKRGQIIGVTGNTGNSEAPHLHHEVSRNGKSVQPLETLVR